jgi:hypothetical protein
MDDSIAEDGDRGFLSVNQRDQLNQLQAGQVRESLNGRMEGYWRPRKGIVEKTGAFTTGGNPLQLPFYLVGTSVAITAASVTAGVVTLTTASAHGLTNGATLNIEGIGYTTGTDPNGVFTAATASASSITYALVGGSGTYTTTSASVITSTSKAITNATASSGVISITINSHGFEAGSSGWATVSGLDAAVNGDYLLTYFDANTLRYTVPGVTSITDTVGTLSQMPINDAANANVRASCLFSDPNTGNKEFVIVALDTVAKKIDLDENNTDANGYLSSTDIPYPPGLSLGADTDMIQVFDKVMLFRDGQQAFEWYPNGRQILSASQFGTTVTVNVREHGLLAGASVTIAGLTGGTPANGTFTVLASPAPTQDTFAYTFTTSQTQDFDVSAATMTDGFTLSPGGDYTQPQVFSIKGDGVEVDSGLVTLTVESNLTLKENDPIVIYESTIPELDSIVGEQYYLTSASINQLQFYAPVPNITVRNLTSASVSGSIVKLITTEDHGLPLGTQINVNEVTYSTGTNPNGIHTTVRQVPNISSATQSANVVTINCSGHGFSTGNSITIDGIEFTTGTNPNGVFTITVVNSNTFTYPLAGASGTYVTTNAFATSDDLKKRLLYSLTGVSGTYGVASAYITTATGATSQQVEVGGRFSVGGGFMHQPGAPWGVYFQRRLWVPHYYNSSGPYDAPVYISSKIKDEIAVSDILDTTTFDQIENQFRISGGTADYVVGMHGFYEDGLIVFNRNSLHLISGTQGSLLDTKVTELTSEIGCLARKTIVSRGNMVMFLSDDGVYAVEFLNDYNLRGADEPISKDIQPYIDRINKDYADRSVGVLFDNRYYLAVPLDSSIGAGDARGNNAILLFNFLNKGWESLDTFGDGRFAIENFVLGSAGVRNNIYAVTANGGLHQLEAVDTSNDSLSVSNTANVVVTPVIDSTLITRGYDLGTMERKRFTDAQFVMQNLPGQKGEYNISFAAEDPDSAQPIGTTTDFLGGAILEADSPNEAETAGIRCRLGGIRGYTGTMILTRTVGSPKINSIKVAGSVTNRQIISQK